MHAILRARERYGIELTREDLAALAEQCRNKRTILVDHGCRSIHLVEHAGTAMKAVFGPAQGRIFTFLARDHGLKFRGKQRGRKNCKRHYGGRKKA